MQEKEKYLWADNLRVAATVAVIVVHASASFLPFFGGIPAFNWWTAHLFDSISRFCVPVFVMLSGALLLPRETPLIEFLKKRISRVVFPFLFWSFAYSFLKLVVQTQALTELVPTDFMLLFFRQIISDDISYHFWYIYMIIGLYLITPFLGKWVRNCSDKEIYIFLGIWLAAIFMSDYAETGLKLNNFLRYIGYLVLGYYFSTRTFRSNILRLSWIMMSVGFLITVIGTYLISSRQNGFNPLLYNYSGLNIILFSSGVFLFFKYNNWNTVKTYPIRNFINYYSYGIYLVHVLILSQIKFRLFLENPYIGIPATVVLCITGSGFVVYFMNKLPWGRYISG